MICQVRRQGPDRRPPAGDGGRGQPRRPRLLPAQGDRLGAPAARAHRPGLGARLRRGPRRPAQRPVPPRGTQAPGARRERRSPAVQWADELAAWAIDPEILAAAPESPYGFPPEVFAAGQYASPSPLAELARAALRPGGLCSTWAPAPVRPASRPSLPAATCTRSTPSPRCCVPWRPLPGTAGSASRRTTGCGPTSPTRCRCATSRSARTWSTTCRTWCRSPTALTRHARDLVVVELTGTHPLTRLAPMWEAVHHQPRPDGPTAELAVAVLREAGSSPTCASGSSRRSSAPARCWTPGSTSPAASSACRRSARPEVEELMQRHPPQPRRAVVLSWPGAGLRREP